ALDWFWRLRGQLDRIRGGAGFRRGRRHAEHLRIGDSVDCWRVERFEPGRRLLLATELKLPGRLWLQFEVRPDGTGAQIRQTTVFDPAGYVGLAYWFLLYPVHATVFRAMLRGLREATTDALGPPDTVGASSMACPRPRHGVKCSPRLELRWDPGEQADRRGRGRPEPR